MFYKNKIKAILFDLDGTLYFKGKAIEGASETVEILRSKGYQMRFLTNTDSRKTETLYDRVTKFGINLELGEIHTPVVATAFYISQFKNAKVFSLVSSEIEDCFPNLPAENEIADFVVIGDFSQKVSYSLMNQAFRHIDSGAEILALQKGRYFYSPEGKNLDTGAFVNLFEYATGKKAKVLGKPSSDFFMTAINQLGVKPEEVMIVGDDITTDIEGALNIGAVAVLVKTGKYNDQVRIDNKNIESHLIIESIHKLVELLD